MQSVCICNYMYLEFILHDVATCPEMYAGNWKFENVLLCALGYGYMYQFEKLIPIRWPTGNRGLFDCFAVARELTSCFRLSPSNGGN
jgi:hypothetical protein